ncbi:TadE/TadG family type IV pilus assembly protein [Tropicimonas aquimaris]|uniref:Pilus assembly protein TadG-related protein n=1 Tax=Tropicimonas aquimaris TaxID=914152 RepID=A0ABW3IPF0_9RHOB
MLHSSQTAACRNFGARAAMRRVGAFGQREDGALIVFTLYILICMLLAIGMAIDIVRTEFARIKIQNTTDTAILAAADLEQTLSPEAVVKDHFRRAGIDEDAITITVTNVTNEKIVSTQSNLMIPTMFMDMVGITSLAAPSSGTAEESVTDLEISLILDNSGSMGQNNNYRMNLLKPAAKEFVDTILEADTDEKRISISLVPFATQVTAGAELLSHYPGVTSEHAYSHCVTFEDADFKTTSLPTTQTLARTAHFDPSSTRTPPYDSGRVCSTLGSREILPWSNNAGALKAQIDSMVGQGWTSIEVATKWGLTLLDPSSRSALSAMADKKLVNEEFRGQPFDYTRRATQKFLVVMSDGENTNQYDIRAPYREGPSTVFVYEESGRTRYTYYDETRVGSDKYYRVSEDRWRSTPNSANDAVRWTWPEVWENMGVKKYTQDIVSAALGGTANSYYNDIVDSIASGTKNTRTSEICSAAKAKGVIVFTIGMDTYGQGDATLADCASSASHFYDVESTDISTAFASIARTITQLRLTN